MLKAPISADSHIVEPPNCYVDYIEPKYRDIAPRVEKNVKGVDVFEIEGLNNPIPIGLLAASDRPRVLSRAGRWAIRAGLGWAAFGWALPYAMTKVGEPRLAALGALGVEAEAHGLALVGVHGRGEAEGPRALER